MKALIFSAGLGTRLRPLTDSKPKALLDINGKPLIYYAINKLLQEGISEIVVNVHHHARQLIDYLNSTDFPVKISDESDELLDTGGGLLKAAPLLKGKDPLVVCNVDVLYSLSIKEVLAYHKNTKALATLVVRDRKTSRYLLFDQNKQLCGWRNIASNKEIISRTEPSEFEQMAFSGIQVLSPDIFNKITEQGKFSIIKTYLRLSKQYPIKAFYDTSPFWMDVGKAEQFIQAEQYLKSKNYLK